MEILNIYGENRLAEHTKLREACRGVVICEGKILLSYEANTGQWFIPGGGREGSESLVDCCVRELAEETGLAVAPHTHYLTINEYYGEWLFVSHYYLCRVTGESERALTDAEAENGLEPRWMDLDSAIEMFSKHQDYAQINEMTRGAYLREYSALSRFKTCTDLT